MTKPADVSLGETVSLLDMSYPLGLSSRVIVMAPPSTVKRMQRLLSVAPFGRVYLAGRYLFEIDCWIREPTVRALWAKAIYLNTRGQLGSGFGSRRYAPLAPSSLSPLSQQSSLFAG